MADRKKLTMGRRSFLGAAGSLAAVPLVEFGYCRAASSTPAENPLGRRKLGSLEVSSLGIGVQNMSRTYQTTIPSRPEMHAIIRTAHERGVTFYDAAEAYSHFGRLAATGAIVVKLAKR